MAAARASVSGEIIERVKTAAAARVVQASPRATAKAFLGPGEIDRSCVIAIGSSTGGTEALREVLTRLPKNIPPIVIVQHIPPVFSGALAKRLDELCEFKVKEAEDGDRLLANQVLIAPGGKQMQVVRAGVELLVRIDDSAPRNLHKPSVDVLFDSVAKESGANAIGVILTGMGADGAQGLMAMRQAGALTIAQNEASCVVYGMPRRAFELGAVKEVLDLPQIAESLVRNVMVTKRRA